MKIASLLLASLLSSSASAFYVGPKATAAVTRTTTSSSSSTRLYAEDEEMSAEAISSLTKDVKTVLTVEEVDATLPHRYPFALVDKVIYLEPGKKAIGVKSVTKNEEFFQGHFPGQPVMPGVLQVEALAQLAGIICLRSEGADEGQIFLFAGVDGVKWKKPVVPGDSLVMEAEIVKFNAKFGIAKGKGKAYVDGQVAVEVGEMTFALAKT